MARPETSLRDLAGEEFGPYRLIRRLGVGGMAETFEALRTGPDGFEQRVCIKLVLPFHQQNREFIELFHREAKLAARLRHSNIVGVIDFGEIGGRSYIALELVDGCDLRTLLDAQDRRRLLPEQVSLIGLDLAAALEHAHNPESRRPVKDDSGSVPRSIIHRDISPSNVLISCLGEIMLTDFGVAKMATGTARQQSAIKGKIPYMSPEQLRGEPVDARSDLFSLGVVMFEALSGERPYEGVNDPATILLALKGDHPSLKSLVPRAPAELCEVIELLVLPNAGERPQTAAEVAELLDTFTPKHRTRRQLGEIAAATPRPGQALGVARSSAAAGRASGEIANAQGVTASARTQPRPPTPAAAITTSVGAEGPRSPRARRRPLMIVAGVGAVFAIVGGLAWGLSNQKSAFGTGPVQETTGQDTQPAAVAPAPPPSGDASGDRLVELKAEPELEPRPAPATSSTRNLVGAPKKTRPARPEAAALGPANLTVIAIPWGDVWIDGEPVGSSPLKDYSVKSGRHEISVGQGGPDKTRTVRLRPGQKSTLRFDLTE